MSKIIVDQIAKNGGVTLTIPSADGTANQPVVTNGSGVLAFSPLAMPAADGTANKPLRTDGSGQLGFAPYALPAADGTANQLLETNGSGQLSFANPPANTQVKIDSPRTIGSIMTSSSRDNVYSTGEWSSSGAMATYNNNWNNATSITQGWNFLMGDGYPDGTTQIKYVDDGQSNEYRRIKYSMQNRLGHRSKDRFEYDNSTGDYSGFTLHAMPVRNTTASSITRSIGGSRTGGGGNYGGHSTLVYTPNAATYAGATAGTWAVANNTSSTGEAHYNHTCDITIPAYTTIIIVQTSGWWYQTTYRFKDSNMFYNLDTFFPQSGDLVCDLRMLDTLATGRVQGETYQSSNPYKYYNLCALMHGDR